MADGDHGHNMVKFSERHTPITPVDQECDSDQYTDTDSELEEYEQCDCVEEHETDSQLGKIPYLSIYEPGKEEAERGYFIPSKAVKVTIASAHRDADRSVHLISPYIYTINVEHGNFIWTVERRYADFQNLYNHLVMFRATEKLKQPINKLRPHRHHHGGGTPRYVSTLKHKVGEGLDERGVVVEPLLTDKPDEDRSTEDATDIVRSVLKRKSTQHQTAPLATFESPPRGRVVATPSGGGGGDAGAIVGGPAGDAEVVEKPRSPRKRAHKMPKFPLIPDSLIGEDHLDARRDELQCYLDGILHIPSLRNHKETAEFLEVSRLSFVNNLGSKRKEGLVKKRPGGRHDQPLTHRLYCRETCGKWNKRWLVVKDSFIAYINPHNNLVREVMLFDNCFDVKTGGWQVEGVNHGVEVMNFCRNLIFKAENNTEAEKWKNEIETALNGKGKIWKTVNQFGSFYPVREHSFAQWFVDGKGFMEHAATMLDLAKEEIFITDWFLSPELFLRRPPAKGSRWQLMEILKRKAEQGVRVCIMLYKEVEMVLGIGSGRAKQVLMALHPNILVFRHPDTVPIPSLWAHHEKIIVIDQNIAFIGGIDLCYGRWDDYRHKLTDLGGEPAMHTRGSTVGHPITPMDEIEAIAHGPWPPRRSEERSSPTPSRDEPDNADVGKQVEGVIFTETPELVLKRTGQAEAPVVETTAATKPASKWKMVSVHSNESVNGEPLPRVESGRTASSPTPKGSGWSKIQAAVVTSHSDPSGGTNPMARKMDFAEVVKKYQEYVDSGKVRERKMRENTPPMQRRKQTKLQKAFSTWKQRLHRDEQAEEDEIYKEYERMISVEMLENQLDTGDGLGKLWIGKDYVNFIYRDVVDLEHAYCDFVDRDVIPRLPWHDISSVVYGSAARDAARHFIQRWNQIKWQKFKYDDIYPYLMPKSYDNVQIPNVFRRISQRCTAQVLRSGGLWSCGVNCINDSIHQAYIYMITNAQHYIYIENQFFVSMINSCDVTNLICKTLFERILKAHRLKQKFRVYVLLPLLPAFEGELGTPTGYNMQAVLYWTYASICKGENSLLYKLEQESEQNLIFTFGLDYEQYITFFSLRTHADLCDRLLTELVYIHSKLIIVDDRLALIGSANINDRSQLGNRDSEMALYVEDVDMVDSTMNEENYKAGKFANSLRRQVFGEHLGLLDFSGKLDPQAKFDISDPVSDEFWNYVRTVAKTNTRIYEDVFKCYPTNLVRTKDEFDKYKKEKDTAPAVTDRAAAMNSLSEIEGYLVEFPLKFLCDFNLFPSGTKEGAMPNALYV